MYVMSVILPTILNVYLTFLCVSRQVFFAYLFVYTVPSSTPSFIALEELHTWLAWIEHWVPGDGARELEVTYEEHREYCVSILSSSLSRSWQQPFTAWQAHLQQYPEPSAELLPATSGYHPVWPRNVHTQHFQRTHSSSRAPRRI